MEIRIYEKLARAIAAAHPKLTGRDVKNLLKLAQLVTAGDEERRAFPDVINFVKRFKPTAAEGEG